ncbi:ABC transporter permease [Clostridium sp. YIM B02506]|uniref:ABC transporter permease n=1 Tax=Clostridium sp. YIM B02506 TaxID=2910680 RepID=UPI001EEE35FE|nr:ABC transporter permease [Clostridium sp. YIM B02506]
MIRFKSSLKELWNRKILTFLIILQLALGLFHIILSVNVYYSMNYLKNNNNSLLDMNTTYILRTNNRMSSMVLEENIKNKVQDVYKELNNSNLIDNYGTYSVMQEELLNSSRKITEDLKDTLTSPEIHRDKPTFETITINKGYYDMLKNFIYKGKGFTSEDFKSKVSGKRGVILGSFFEKYFEIGDVINDKYIVYGFIKKEKFIPTQNDGYIYSKFDKRMFIPKTSETNPTPEDYYLELVQETMLKIKNKETADKINKMLTDKGQDLQLYIKNLGESINDTSTQENETEKPMVVMEIIITIFFILGIVITTLYSILLRKREFGIKLAFGESMQGLFKQIITENFISVSIGFLLSLAYFRIKYADVFKYADISGIAGVFDVKLTPPILLILFLITFSIVMVSNIIVFQLFIKKLQLKDLIGGME